MGEAVARGAAARRRRDLGRHPRDGTRPSTTAGGGPAPRPSNAGCSAVGSAVGRLPDRPSARTRLGDGPAAVSTRRRRRGFVRRARINTAALLPAPRSFLSSEHAKADGLCKAG